jgi:hypothetical protein
MVYYDSNVLVNQMFYGVVGNYIIRFAKKSRFLPWINEARPWVTRGLGIFLATISALGIEHTYSYTAQEGVFTLTLTGLTIPLLYDHTKQVVIAYIFQQVPYHAMKQTDATATVLVGGSKTAPPMMAEATTKTD